MLRLVSIALRSVAYAGTLFSLAACAALQGTSSGPRWQENGRVARDLPTMFVADTTNRSGRATLGDGCTGRLTDPRDGALLVLVRSMPIGGAALTTATRSPTRDNIPPTIPAQRDFRGDYSVAKPGRYGVAPDELLRIDCVAGKGLGIVSAR